MTTRLQLLLDDKEFQEIEAAAASQRMTVADWARQALRSACSLERHRAAERKLRVAVEASQYGAPTGDIEQLLGQTAQGRWPGVASS